MIPKVILALIFSVGVGLGISTLSKSTAPISAKSAPTPEPSPTPVNQNWRVFFGEISELEVRLRELNKEQVEVYYERITISADGKRFVLILDDGAPGYDE